MPKHQDSIYLPDTDKETVLATVYETFKTLGWNVMYAGDEKIIAETVKTWKSNGQHVLAGYENNGLTVESEMVHGESFDMRGMNKKNVFAFSEEFKKTQVSISAETLEANRFAITALRAKTAAAIEAEQKEADEVSEAMNLKDSNLYVTYSLIILNVLIFVLMAFAGAGIIEPNGLVHIKWGSNFTPLTLSGDSWRLFSSMFLHFGIIHLLMNMYCLFTIGVYLEPMLGKIKYITAYICTGILASTVSLWWHTEATNSAGASGAIFGLYGLFFSLLTTDLIPKSVRGALLKNIGIFIVFNLVYGMKGGVDNAAHIGGLISGFVIGYLYLINIRAQKRSSEAKWVIPAVIVLSLAIAYVYTENHKTTSAERENILTEIKDSSRKDADNFTARYKEFSALEVTAVDIINDTALERDNKKIKLAEIALPALNKAELILTQMQQMDAGEQKHKRAEDLVRYLALRKEEVIAQIGILSEEPGALQKLRGVREQMGIVLQELNAQ